MVLETIVACMRRCSPGDLASIICFLKVGLLLVICFVDSISSRRRRYCSHEIQWSILWCFSGQWRSPCRVRHCYSGFAQDLPPLAQGKRRFVSVVKLKWRRDEKHDVLVNTLASQIHVPHAIRREQVGFRHAYKHFNFVSYRSVMRTPGGAKMCYRGMLLERVIHAPSRSIAGAGNGKMESLSCTSRAPFNMFDGGTAVNFVFENLRIWSHTVLYMRLCFQVDATSKAAIQLGLEIAHLFAQFAKFFFKSSHLVVDFVD